MGCEAQSKGAACPNHARREVSGYWVCRDHLNALKDGEELLMHDGKQLRLG